MATFYWNHSKNITFYKGYKASPIHTILYMYLLLILFLWFKYLENNYSEEYLIDIKMCQ